MNELTEACMPMNASVNPVAKILDSLHEAIWHRPCSIPSMMKLEMKSGRTWEYAEIPIDALELAQARADFKVWVKTQPTGPLDGSWGALMDWWLMKQRPEWKKFDTIDRCYLKYAVGLPDKRIRVI